MVTYSYKCENAHTIDLNHSMHQEPEVFCAECGKRMRKLPGFARAVFKGSGFYSTDKGDK